MRKKKVTDLVAVVAQYSFPVSISDVEVFVIFSIIATATVNLQ